MPSLTPARILVFRGVRALGQAPGQGPVGREACGPAWKWAARAWLLGQRTSVLALGRGSKQGCPAGPGPPVWLKRMVCLPVGESNPGDTYHYTNEDDDDVVVTEMASHLRPASQTDPPHSLRNSADLLTELQSLPDAARLPLQPGRRPTALCDHRVLVP